MKKINNLPQIKNFLIWLGIYVSTKFVKKNFKLPVLMYNGLVLQNPQKQAEVGDIIQFTHSLVNLNKRNKILKKQLLSDFKKSKKIYKLIVQSQWKEKKKKRKNLYENFVENNIKSYPVWSQVNLLCSAAAVVFNPVVETKKKTTNYTFPLEKLTPWRLKI